MKRIKIILGSVAVLAIASVTVFNVNLNSQNDKLSAISLANVEALAEEGNNGVSFVECHSVTQYDSSTNTTVEVTQKTCSGNGPLSCEC
ncbi:MAG: NVEALA domain-containing protein [Dysgonamonadaceae bacterium]|jgi:hypothetical protein|nr:NVEALA domain-containing protein [Dysgonamonadaceae bacterium]